MTPDELLSWRLAGQLLSAPGTADPAAVVAHLGAIQSQEYGPSLWAVGQRAGVPDAAAVEAEIERGTILRTWPMRGTIHLVAAQDAGWMVGLLAGRRVRQVSAMYQRLGLTEAVLERSAEIVFAALSSEGRIKRTDMYAILSAHGIDCSGSYHGSRGGHIMLYLSTTGLVCLGPLAGKQPTFVLLDKWAPDAPAPDDPVAEIAVRYFTSHGPATARDLSWWAGLTLREVREGAIRAGARLVAEELDGETYWRCAQPPTSAALDGAFLLPAFDEYTVAYAERILMQGSGRELPRGDLLNPVMVLDGRVVGLWKTQRVRNAAQIMLAPLDPAMDVDRFSDAAERYASFLGMSAETRIAALDDVRRTRPPS